MSDLPHIFPLKQVLCKVAEGAIGKDLLRKLELNGIAGYSGDNLDQYNAAMPILLKTNGHPVAPFLRALAIGIALRSRQFASQILEA